MGLFDRISGSVINKLSGEHAPKVQAALDLLSQHGGLPGVLAKFSDAGFEAQVESWIGDGANLPLTAAQVKKALGEDTLTEIGNKFDLRSKEVAVLLADYLPIVVDKLTHDGKVPQSQSAVMMRAVSLLK